MNRGEAMRDVFYLVGPTAVGKSSLAIDVAEQLGGEIINADAFQIYRGLDILTAKPDVEMRQRVPHHLLSMVPLGEEMSAARFREIALSALGRVREKRKLALVVGGSGLYVKALTRGFDEAPAPDAKRRAELAALSLEELVRRLGRAAPDVAERIDLKNRRRVARAIEIAESVGMRKHVVPSAVEGPRGADLQVAPRDPSTSLRFGRDDRQEKRFGHTDEMRAGHTEERRSVHAEEARGMFLLRERDDLYARINERVDAMFRDGVEEEVARLDEIGPTAGQALGLREIQQLLAGEFSRKDCIARIQQATRRYAKRQLTWFRHQTNFPQLNLTALSHREAVSAIIQRIAQG